MYREIITCIIIVIAIVSLDIFCQKYTEKSVDEITEKLSILKEELLSDTEQIDSKVKDLEENWKEKHDKLAYYIEHDELEKVDTSIVNMKSYIETNNYSSAIAELDEGKFILEHIQQKNAFNLQNIF